MSPRGCIYDPALEPATRALLFLNTRLASIVEYNLENISRKVTEVLFQDGEGGGEKKLAHITCKVGYFFATSLKC